MVCVKLVDRIRKCTSNVDLDEGQRTFCGVQLFLYYFMISFSYLSDNDQILLYLPVYAIVLSLEVDCLLPVKRIHH